MGVSESTPLVRERGDGRWMTHRAVALAVGALAVGALARTGGGGGGARTPRAAALAGTLSATGAATLEAYGGLSGADVHVMRWTHESGFVYDPRDHAADLEVKMRTATELAAKTIETYYPERLKANQPPFEVLYVVTDFPQTACVAAAAKTADPKCADAERWSPIYTFGSAPRDEKVLPTLVGATLITLASRVMVAMGRPTVEKHRSPWSYVNLFDLADVPEAERERYAWENLKNEIIWRGTDYPFLGPAFPNFKESTCFSILGRGLHSNSCQLEEMKAYGDKTQAFTAMLGGNAITPRTRAVLMSKLDGSWINALFVKPTFAPQRSEAPALGEENRKMGREETRSVLGRELGIDTDTPLSGDQHAHYKYQFDLGGWGGTTWTGTIYKLSMPGVLFHHETSMKDSFFDALEPWKHYIPVKEDLSDLRERYDWARAHDEECRRISETATAWVRNFTSRRSILEHNYLKLAVPLERALDPTGVGAYRIPFRDAHPEYDDRTVKT